MWKKCHKSLQRLERMRLVTMRGPVTEKGTFLCTRLTAFIPTGPPNICVDSCWDVCSFSVILLYTAWLVHRVGFDYLYILILAQYPSKHCFPSLFLSSNPAGRQLHQALEITGASVTMTLVCLTTSMLPMNPMA